MQTFNDLLTSLDGDGDYRTLGVIADLLEEEGQSSYIAWRWMFRWERTPKSSVVFGRQHYQFLVTPNPAEITFKDSNYIVGIDENKNNSRVYWSSMFYNMLVSNSRLRIYCEAIQIILGYQESGKELPW